MDMAFAPYSDQGGNCDKPILMSHYDEFLSLASSNTIYEWSTRLQRVLDDMGFRFYLFRCGSRKNQDDPLEDIVTTFPEKWIELYRQENFLTVDPIPRHCRESVIPLFWSRECLLSSGRTQRFWRVRADHGLQCGVSIPLKCENRVGSLNVALGVDSEDEFDSRYWPGVEKLFLLALFAQEGLPPNTFGARCELKPLSLREMEALKWVGAGKTSWEIGVIIGCSERTVNFHVSNAFKKLNVCNRQQAVSVAIANGLIDI